MKPMSKKTNEKKMEKAISNHVATDTNDAIIRKSQRPKITNAQLKDYVR